MLNDRKTRISLIVLFMVWILSLYGASQFLGEIMAYDGENIQQGWIVQSGDTVTFEVFVNSNSTIRTIVDQIMYEYKFKFCEEDIWGNKLFQVRAKEVPKNINITQITAQIINFSGPVLVEQKINNTWELKENITLPFFIPIGLWEPLFNEFRNLLPENANVTYSRSWVGEYSYFLSWFSDKFQFDVYYSWEETDGVLQAMVLNVSYNGEMDSLEMHLSGQKMQYEEAHSAYNTATILSVILFISALSLSVILPITAIHIVVTKRREAKEKEIKADPQKMLALQESRKRRATEILIRWDEIKRTYILLWIGINAICIVLGYGTFLTLIQISETAENGMFIITLIILSLVITVALGGLLYQYLTRVVLVDSMKKERYFDMEPFLISFMLGFAIHIIYPMCNVSSIPSLYGKLVMLGLAIALLCVIALAYFVFNPWKKLNKIKSDLDNIKNTLAE